MPFDTDALLEELTRLRDAVEESKAEGSDTDAPAPREGASGENTTIKAIRAEAKRAAKERDAAMAELEELRKFKAETSAAARDAALAEAGLTPAQAAVFTKAYDEVTEENLYKFKSEVLGLPKPEDGDWVPGSEPFAPLGFPGEKREALVSVEEFTKMMKSENPYERQKADELARAGKVAFKNN